LKEYLQVDGSPVRKHGIERGKPVLYSKSEWLERSVKAVSVMYKRNLILSLIIIPVILGISLLLTLMDGDWTFFIIMASVCLAIFGAIAITFSVILAVTQWGYVRRMRDGFPVPGLYENGLELPIISPWRSHFAPYSEIRSVTVTNYFRTKYVQVNAITGLTMAELPEPFISDAVLIILYERAKEEKTDDDEPPELVLYGKPRWSFKRMGDTGE
jgi:hypothetical protein